MSPSTAATTCGTPHSPDSSPSRQTPPGHAHCPPLLTSAHCLPYRAPHQAPPLAHLSPNAAISARPPLLAPVRG